MSHSTRKKSYHVALAVLSVLAAVATIWSISKAASSPTVTSISPSNGVNSGPVSISSVGGTGFIRGWDKETSLLSNWRMDESSGATVVDSSGNGNNGGGGVITSGHLGNARALTASDRISFSDIDNLTQTSTASLAYWWMASSTPVSNRIIIQKQQLTGAYRGYEVFHYDFGSGVKLVWRIGRNDIGGNRTYCASATSIPTDGAWHHYVITQSGGTSCANNVSMYFDGVKEQTLTEYDSGTGDSSNSEAFYVGASATGSTAAGSIDELRVYTQALSADDVTALYTVTGVGSLKLTTTGQSDILCTGLTLTNSTTLSNGSCNITGAAAGARNVQVTNPDGGSGTLTNGFTIYSVTVTGISPSSACNIGPASISSVTGTNFARGWDKEAGLLSDWRMDESSGTTVADSSGSGNNGTASGAAVASGHLGNARALTVNDTIDFGNIDNLSQTSTASLSFWWKASSTPASNRAILNKVENSGSYRGYEIFHDDAGSGVKLGWFIGQSDVTGKRTYCESSTSIPTDGAWHHYVITQTGGTSCASNISMYFDGAKEQSLTQGDSGAGDSQGSTASLKLGSYLNGYTAAGSIDELRIYSRALADDDVTALYNATGPGSVKLRKSGQADIACTGFTFSSSTALTSGSCDITGAATSTWDVQVTNPDSRSGTLTNGFTVH